MRLAKNLKVHAGRLLDGIKADELVTRAQGKAKQSFDVCFRAMRAPDEDDSQAGLPEYDEAMLPWPKPGDRPFSTEGAHWTEVAMVDTYHYGFALRITGFKDAADILVREAILDRSRLNTLIYPIVFNYRHYLELLLKELLMTVRRATRSREPMPTHHRLVPLWEEIEKYAHERPAGDRETLEVVDAVIRGFENADPKSMAFRYGVGKEGDPLVTDEHARIDVRNLAMVMDRTGAFLDSYYEMLADGLSLMDSESGW